MLKNFGEVLFEPLVFRRFAGACRWPAGRGDTRCGAPLTRSSKFLKSKEESIATVP